MLAPPGELAPPPRGNPGSATGMSSVVLQKIEIIRQTFFELNGIIDTNTKFCEEEISREWGGVPILRVAIFSEKTLINKKILVLLQWRIQNFTVGGTTPWVGGENLLFGKILDRGGVRPWRSPWIRQWFICLWKKEALFFRIIQPCLTFHLLSHDSDVSPVSMVTVLTGC